LMSPCEITGEGTEKGRAKKQDLTLLAVENQGSL
jgi:hypothetical protein